MAASHTNVILYCRVPGLLSQAARSGRPGTDTSCPLVVAHGRLVRDACPLALARAIQVGASVVQARRLCPTLLAVPLEEVDARPAGGLFRRSGRPVPRGRA